MKPTEALSPSMGEKYQKIQKFMFDLDIEKEHAALVKGLSLEVAGHLADYATLADAVEKAAANAQLAHTLYMMAFVDHAVFEVELAKSTAELEAKALRVLEAQKEHGSRSKSITGVDIKAHVTLHYAVESAALVRAKAEAEAMLESFKSLADKWKGRGFDLGKLLDATRR